MKFPTMMLCAVVLACTGVTAASAGDPFEDASAAVRWKKNEQALALISSGQFDVNQQNSEGYTLLHLAADQNNLEIARELLKRGADPNIKSSIGSSVADMAYSGSPLLAEVLKAGGKFAKNAPYTPAPVAGTTRKAPATTPNQEGSGVRLAPAQAADPRRKMCNARHNSSSALCSDSTCKMREYRKWQTCLKTGSYY